MASHADQLAKNFSFSSFSKAADLKKRIWFTIILLIIYRFGTYVPLPGINTVEVKNFTSDHSDGILAVLDLFSGGSILRMAIFSLNIVPYISASIVFQLLTVIVPRLDEMRKDGESGQRQINRYTRYLAVFFALVQGFGIALALERINGGALVFEKGAMFRFTTMTSLACGTLIVMWFGEQIKSRGIGNGSSVIIYTGIVANLPSSIKKMFVYASQGTISQIALLGIILFIVAIILCIVFFEKATRNIPIQYPRRQTMTGFAKQQPSYLPLKINNAGVVPPIFASSLLLMPATIYNFMRTPVVADSPSLFAKIAMMLRHGAPLYVFLFAIAIIFFSFFYTAIMFNPTETADNFKKSGTYIPGIRPGESTADYLDGVLTRLTVVGSLYLCAVCILPEILFSSVGLPQFLGGTSLLIMVGTTSDIVTQIQSQLMKQQYSSLFKRGMH